MEERLTSRCSELNRKPLNERAGLMLTFIAALLLLITGARVLAEEEPAARAPLPPPLRSVPAEAGKPQTRTATPDPAPGPNQSASGPPTIRFDRPKPQSSPKKPRLAAAPHRSAAAAKGRETPMRSADLSKYGDSHRQRHRAIAPGTKQGRDRSPVGPRIGYLSPPNDDSVPRIENTTIPRTAPPRAPPPYYPNFFAGPPAYGYAPSYPFAWAPPGPGIFR